MPQDCGKRFCWDFGVGGFAVEVVEESIELASSLSQLEEHLAIHLGQER